MNFIKDSCAVSSTPNKQEGLGYTCYDEEALNKLKDLWNARHPDDKITSTTPREIWKHLKTQMKNVCYRESCWLEQSFTKNKLPKDILKYTFAPKQPDEWKRNPVEWLSSIDICNLMNIYEKKYKCYQFMGPSPIDYDAKLHGDYVWPELATFDLKYALSKGFNKFGIIFNLDPHYKSGSHWVAAFIRMKTNEIMFFDSYGEPPDKQIMKFMENIKEQAQKLGIPMEIKSNDFRHQYSDSECGMYSLYFVIQMLMDVPFKTITTKKIPDKKMIDLRNAYFNPA